MKILRWTAGLLSLLIATSVVVGCGSITINPNLAQATSGTNSGSGGTGSGTGSAGSGSSGSGSSGSGSSGSGSGSSGSGSGGSGSGGSGSSGSGSSGSGSGGSGSGSGGSGSSGSGSSGSGSGGSGSGGSGGSGSGSGGSGSGSSGSGSGSGGSGGSGSGSGGSGSQGGALGLVPANAVSVSAIQAMSTWREAYDAGTSGANGSTGGTMSMVDAPSLSGNAREFQTSYTNSGGERYYANFGKDTEATHFLYDSWVYLDSSASKVANLEMDVNQVMPNGQTVIFGFQCDGYSKTWDTTTNAGTAENPTDKWLHSDAACNLQEWSVETWHHVQVAYSRDDAGNVTYQSVWLDDVEQDINVTAPSAFALGWGPTLLTNLQVDGLGAGGSSTVVMDNLTVYRW